MLWKNLITLPQILDTITELNKAGSREETGKFGHKAGETSILAWFLASIKQYRLESPTNHIMVKVAWPSGSICSRLCPSRDNQNKVPGPNPDGSCRSPRRIFHSLWVVCAPSSTQHRSPAWCPKGISVFPCIFYSDMNVHWWDFPYVSHLPGNGKSGESFFLSFLSSILDGLFLLLFFFSLMWKFWNCQAFV